MMSQRLVININGNRLSLSGVLDYESILDVYKQGQKWLRNLVPEEAIIEMGQLTYSNSAGLLLLLDWLRTAIQEQKAISIEKIPDDLFALIKVSGLDNLLASELAVRF